MLKKTLFRSIRSGDISGVSQWLEREPESLNDTLADGYSAVHAATLFGQVDILRQILSRQALINRPTLNSSSALPLHLAVGYADESIANILTALLLEHGSELNTPQMNGQTALHLAVERSSLLLVRTLVEAGADPFLRDSEGHTAANLIARGTTAGDAALAALGAAIRAELKRAYSLTFEPRE